MNVDVINLNDNSKVSAIDLDPKLFDLDFRGDIIARVVRWQLAKVRSGNHKAKTRAEVKHTTRKPFKQKGTGRARQGMTSVSQMRGGGVVFGPVVRSYAHDLPKKVRAMGLKVAISEKLRKGDLLLVDNLNLDSHKTSDLKKALSNLNIDSGLFVEVDNANLNFKKASSNIIGIDVIPQIGLNVYDILKHDKLIFTVESVKNLMERLHD